MHCQSLLFLLNFNSVMVRLFMNPVSVSKREPHVVNVPLCFKINYYCSLQFLY